MVFRLIGNFYIQLTSRPLLWGPAKSFGLFSYKWQHGLTGLSYLGGGLGLVWATMFGITAMNRCQAWMTGRYGNGEGRPEFRMPVLQLGMILVPLGVIVFGWTAQKQTHWVLPLLGTAIISCGTQIGYISIQIYIVDAFETYSASALAGVAFARGVIGCVLTIIGFRIFVSLGYGW